jgi:hypothetical protein
MPVVTPLLKQKFPGHGSIIDLYLDTLAGDRPQCD